MASISSLGIGSGMDLNALLDKLSLAEQKRLTPLTQQQTSAKAKVTAFGVLKNALEKLATASAALNQADKISTTSISSTHSAFSVTTDGKATAGDYTVTVQEIAKAQSLLSPTVNSSSEQLGTTGASSRTLTITQPGREKPLEVTLNDHQTSLIDIRDAINKQEGGVNASIIKADDDSYHLVLTSKETGTHSEMSISVDGDEKLANLLTYDASGSSNAMRETVGAQNAKLTVNGITITRQSNTVSDAPQGVTLTLKAPTEQDKPEQLQIVRDSAPMTEAIKSWVDAYNALQTTIASQTKYTAVEQGEVQSTGNGALIGDGTLRNIQTQLKNQLALAQPGAEFRTLNGLGIKQGIDGKLEIDNDRLKKAIEEKPAGVKEFFIGDGKETGFAIQTDRLLKNALDSHEGLLKTATDGLNNTIKSLDSDVKRTTDSINATIERYKTQFTQLDKMMSSLNNTSSYLLQQFK